MNKKYGSVPEKVNVGNKKKAVLRYNAAEYGHLQEIGTTNNGCGRQPMPAQKKLPDVMSAKETEAGAEGLRESVPPVYRQYAVSYTDFRSSYEEIFPSKRHRPVPKQSGKTCYIERFNNTMRQRISRLVRKALSFSKKIGNHIGAIFNFIHYCNERLRNLSDILPLPI